jgi:hypothetical protein
LSDLDSTLLEEIEEFFKGYHRIQRHEFRPAGRGGPATARKLVEPARVR